MMSSPQLYRKADELVEIAFSKTPGEKADDCLARLNEQGQQLQIEISDALVLGTEYPAQTIRAAGFVACLPSLRKVVKGTRQDGATAIQVAENFQALSEDILTIPQVHPTRSPNGGVRGGQGSITGQLSETSVHGILWWSVAHGLRDEQTYILPATTAEDSGTRKRDGYSMATDLVLRVNGNGNRQDIQVKTATSRAELAKIRRYYPGTVVLAVSALLEQRGADPRELLSMLATNKVEYLGKISGRMEQYFQLAREQADYHRRFKSREAARQRLR